MNKIKVSHYENNMFIKFRNGPTAFYEGCKIFETRRVRIFIYLFFLYSNSKCVFSRTVTVGEFNTHKNRKPKTYHLPYA